MNHTTTGRALAIAAGLSFTTGALVILLGDVITTPAQWTTYHLLTVLTVFGTIAAGHLMHDAVRARHPFATLGFLVLFLSGTGLVVYQSVGRQAETSDAKVFDAEASNKAIADKGADLARARRRFEDANAAADDEMTGQRCGPRCRDWKQRAIEVKAHIAQLERDIAGLGPQKTVAPKAEKMADVAALFGADKARAKAILMLMEPFFWTLFFEIGSIVSLGFAFRRRVTVSATVPTVSSVPETPVGGGGKAIRLVPKVALEDYELKALRQALGNGCRLTNDELAAAMGVTKAEASRRATKAMASGMVSRVRAGRHVAISLQHAH